MEESFVDVGMSAVDVVIEEPVPMSGFAARTEPSTGTGVPAPRACAVALGDVALVFLDVVGVDARLADEVRTRAGLDGHVSVAATHTHAGPCVMHAALGPISTVAFEAWAAAGAEAARRARSGQRAALAEWLDPVATGPATNRRKGTPARDARLSALRFTGRDGERIGVLASYPCHPTVLGPLNRQLSGDYPAFLRDELESRWGGVAVFATGCAGDINVGHAASASYLLGAGALGRTMDDARRIGTGLGDAVLAGDWSPVDLTGGIRWASAAVELEQVPLDSPSLPEQVERWKSECEDADPGVAALLNLWIAWAATPGAGRRAAWRGNVGRLDVGEASVFLLPGEPFLDAERMIRDARPGKVLALGYWEDCPGYFPSSAEYAAGGYEVEDAHRYYGQPAPFEEGSLERLVASALALGADTLGG